MMLKFLYKIVWLSDIITFTIFIYLLVVTVMNGNENEHYVEFFWRDYFWRGVDFIIISAYLLLYGFGRCWFIIWNKKALSRGFEEVKDLIRGSISADIGDIE